MIVVLVIGAVLVPRLHVLLGWDDDYINAVGEVQINSVDSHVRICGWYGRVLVGIAQPWRG